MTGLLEQADNRRDPPEDPVALFLSVDPVSDVALYTVNRRLRGPEYVAHSIPLRRGATEIPHDLDRHIESVPDEQWLADKIRDCRPCWSPERTSSLGNPEDYMVIEHRLILCRYQRRLVYQNLMGFFCHSRRAPASQKAPVFWFNFLFSSTSWMNRQEERRSRFIECCYAEIAADLDFLKNIQLLPQPRSSELLTPQ